MSGKKNADKVKRVSVPMPASAIKKICEVTCVATEGPAIRAFVLSGLKSCK